ncbi:MAG: InlB B-repeat-containing protein, partial [Paludibacteraceae bacterium]|nr:InlB B-repeat-containing protein [Paludibacteraceae bacterium]
PSEGYHFVKWSDGNTEATRTIVVTDNVTLTAEFAINVYTVTLTAENGTVTGAGEYQHGQTANIAATPNEGYHFVKWSDGDTSAIRTIIVVSDLTLTAEFAQNSIGTELNVVDESDVKVYTRDNMLYIEGVETNYYLFDASGRLVYTGSQSILSLPRGVYIIVSDGKSQKVVL